MLAVDRVRRLESIIGKQRAGAGRHGSQPKAQRLSAMRGSQPLRGRGRSVFARRFSEAVGTAPVAYLLRWRMAFAKDALLHGRSTLDEIAAQVGYQSASAFSTAFRKRVSCPPSDYAANGLRLVHS
jgi:hypothetical protein